MILVRGVIPPEIMTNLSTTVIFFGIFTVDIYKIFFTDIDLVIFFDMDNVKDLSNLQELFDQRLGTLTKPSLTNWITFAKQLMTGKMLAAK